MEDKILTIVFGSLGATLALIGILFAYLQIRGSRHRATTPDEERVVPLPVVAQEDTNIGPPAVVVVQEGPVTNSPYASSPATQIYDRADNFTDATPIIDLPSAIDCRRQCQRSDRYCNTMECLDKRGSCAGTD